MSMFEYKFIKVELKGFAKLKPQENYQQLIKTHAADGWRLVQIFAPSTVGYGLAEYFELIFERQKQP